MSSLRISKALLFCVTVCSSLTPSNAHAQISAKPILEPTVKERIHPVRIVWKSEIGDRISNAESLLKKGNGQADLNSGNLCVLKSDKDTKPGILLDFGKELHGGIQLVTGIWPGNKPVRVRIRLGESVSEAMSDVNSSSATNDHALRDFVTALPWLGKLEFGNSGFRFARIDIVDTNATVILKEVNAMAVYRDIPYLGSFNSSDTLLNKIWQTGAYTVHLNMQDYLWDGVKRDRLVWVGDMHPEVTTINAVFGYNEVVAKSLDLSRDITPLPQWMNGISAYSMWWIIIHRDLYKNNGNLAYLKEQKDYMVKLLDLLVTKIGDDNTENLEGKFLDWPSSENKPAIHAGLQALMVMSLNAGAEMCVVLKEDAAAAKYRAAVERLKKNIPDINGSKQAAALYSLAGLMSNESANKVLLDGRAKNFSTFYGYYMLQAMAKGGNYQQAMDVIRTYWGAMLKLGATTFWEDFNMDWLPNAAGIDQLVPAGMKDIHGDFGAYCYIGFRHSLAHGWASGPTPWLTEHVLGISVVEAGGKAIRVVPHLGDLKFAEGAFPTKYGIVRVKHTKLANGKVQSDITAPKEVRIIKN
ncbi:alpha-L-rhamnosidase [Pedobacter sp. JCM 36344]|uniref:alpha-L-rhamnosidase-related protein n=1 Tax=Pedobacter sp. JCM 36344 TaxID=3374280 RepID=UPI003978D996